jgi:N-acetylmuramoyl-L-alanine amidase
MDVGVALIDEWHREKGWDGCGYHFVIKRDGNVEEGRHIDAIGAHTKGYNQVSIGICLAGGWKGKFDFTRKQMDALEALIQSLKLVKAYSGARVGGHRDYDKNKQCPGFDVTEWWYNGKWVE